MANLEVVSPYALTTLARVKERLTITTTDFDTKFIRWINSVSTFVEQQCGGRAFVKRTYPNETFSFGARREIYLNLRNFPVWSVSSFQWRAGPPSNPQYTSFAPDQYELMNPQPVPTDPQNQIWYPDGQIRIYGVLPTIYSNAIRVSYVAGYPVDWPNAGNGTTHLLPADLTDLVENLITRRFKRREFAGKSSEGLTGATTSWRNTLDIEDQETLDAYTMAPIFT